MPQQQNFNAKKNGTPLGIPSINLIANKLTLTWLQPVRP
jgi:hypothetical protein